MSSGGCWKRTPRSGSRRPWKWPTRLGHSPPPATWPPWSHRARTRSTGILACAICPACPPCAGGTGHRRVAFPFLGDAVLPAARGRLGRCLWGTAALGCAQVAQERPDAHQPWRTGRLLRRGPADLDLHPRRQPVAPASRRGRRLTAQAAPCITADLPDPPMAIGRARLAVLEINGQWQDLAAMALASIASEIRIPLKPGEHKVAIRRLGYEPLEQTFTLVEGKDTLLRPTWKDSRRTGTLRCRTASGKPPWLCQRSPRRTPPMSRPLPSPSARRTGPRCLSPNRKKTPSSIAAASWPRPGTKPWARWRP